jgi:integrin alpha FG-GAP repeat containing protein 1
MAQGRKSGELSMSVYVAKYEGGFGTLTKQDLYIIVRSNTVDMNPVDVPPSTTVQPIAMDANGDMQIDLLGLVPGSEPIKIWQNIWNASNPSAPMFNM